MRYFIGGFTWDKESQFNRKMELNIEIKRLEQKKNKLLGGDRL